MIVDFQHHFTPRELIKGDPGDKLILHYDENGAPSYTVHSLLYDLDEHIRMMDVAGIDAAWLTSAAGMAADLERSRICNDRAKQAERDFPGRFIGAAHANPLGGPEALKELNRCRHELGFQGVTITSEQDGRFLDAPEFEPFWSECEKLGMFVFVHPALKLNFSQQFDGYDTARSVGREFSLIMATIRLINSGVFDRHPGLTVHMAHLSGGIAGMLARIRVDDAGRSAASFRFVRHNDANETYLCDLAKEGAAIEELRSGSARFGTGLERFGDELAIQALAP